MGTYQWLVNMYKINLNVMTRSINKTRRLLPCALLFCSCLLAAQEKKLVLNTVENWLDTRVDEAINTHHTPGFNIGIIVDGRLALQKNYGVMNVETGVKTNTQTRYQVASITKTFVAALAAKLATSNKVDLDVPINQYIPGVKFHPSIILSKMTLRKLLTHHSGLPSNPINRVNIEVLQLAALFDPTIAAPYSVEQLKQAIATTPSKYTTGERYYYSNYGMHLAAYILAKVSGYDTFNEALTAHILSPLKLHNTFVRVSNTKDSDMATPYVSQNDSSLILTADNQMQYIELPAWTFGEVTGALGLTSNIPDLSTYVMHLMEEAKDSAPINKNARELLFRPNAEFIKDNAHLFEIGLGWRIRTFGRFGTIYTHGGHNDGHHAYILFSREKHLAVIMLTNGPHNINKTIATETLLKLMQNIK
ncbi:MAG: serine hydrolase domain-containing protein [Paraglaciecola sp.]|uniref:serine hydrolase domain-containing protein n=4 Tax=Paraglaciecola sp. TaxID=1920173 RepID=UPI003263A7EC